MIIDCDQHLFEHRTLWRDYIDPGARDEALGIEDDELGYAWLTWRGRRLEAADVSRPHETEEIGVRRERRRAGRPADVHYDEILPPDYWEPGARLERITQMGLDEAVLFPNYGLGWERTLDVAPSALKANMGAWNRWCAEVAGQGGGRLHPVAHLTLRDPDWLEAQLVALSRAGVRLAMVAPALVDGRPLSHRDHDRLWAAFCANGISPVFHVADQRRVFDDAWYTDSPDVLVSEVSSVFLWTAAALACTDLILNGVLERFADLRLGIIELSSIWVPMYLMMLDGGHEFTARLNGRPLAKLSMRPSEYFMRQVRVAAFAYEEPQRLVRKSGDIYMCCSDYPHSEGTDTPVEDYRRSGGDGLTPQGAPELFSGNAGFLLRR